jgi:membrane-associated protease RseP (regulator of RpoE activity)
VPAKIFGVRVSQYMVGFGPTLFSRKAGETEYGVKAIPLGGYISMSGMYPPGKEPKQSSSKVRNFFGKLVQDARSASDESMVGVDSSRAFYHLPVWKRIIIMLGGPMMNLFLAFVLLAILVMGYGQPTASTTVASVTQCVTETGVPAECSDQTFPAPGAEAGLLAGDTIVSIDGVPVSEWNSGTQVIRQSPNQQLRVVVEREGSQETLFITPVATEREAVDENGQPVVDVVGYEILRGSREGNLPACLFLKSMPEFSPTSGEAHPSL